MSKMRIAGIVIACAVARAAHADGFFYEESFGVSSARGGAAPTLSSGLHLRLGVGMRTGDLVLEMSAAGDLAFDRDGATLVVFGGTPKPGHSDLSGIGFDVKYLAVLRHGLELYVRGGPRIASVDGTMGGYTGPGIGAGTGIQLRGEVRALGFLWTPLFFLKRGPKVIGALFLDQGIDAYRMYGQGTRSIDVPIVSTNLGFAIGSDF
ncbi:MAG: hypothetical protein JWO36_76 [Myxococcales bacterium]|nr:hypothetical protein [Myxococcales bacterium]